MLPKYRYDEAVAGRAEAERRLDQMATLFQALLARQGASEPTATQPALTPEEQERRERILAQLEEVAPGLRDILGLRDSIADIRETIKWIKSQQASTAQNYQEFNEYMINGAVEKVAPLLVGEKNAQGQPTTAANLTPIRRATIRQTFIEWIGETRERVARYNRGDESLRDEFAAEFRKEWVDPFQQGTAAARIGRQQQRDKLPIGGTSSAPVTTGPPKLNLNDEDAVYKAAWAHTKAQQAAG